MAAESLEALRARELAMLQREEAYRQILDAIVDMVLVKGAHSRILWANRAFREFYGMSNEQLKELVDAPFNEPDHTRQYVADDLEVYTTGRSLEIPVEPVTRHDGVVDLFHTVKAPIFGDDGRVVMTVGVSRSIGETLELRDQLLRSREQLERDRLATFAAQLPGFLCQLRLAGDEVRFTFVSARVAHYYALSPSELTADPARLYAQVEGGEGVRAALASALRAVAHDGGAVEHVHRARGADGRWRWMELLARAKAEVDGSITFHGYVHDVTARRQIEEERLALVDKLTARTQEMEQFTYTVSHDLKGPLVTIRGFLGNIEDDLRAGRTDRALSDLGRVRAAAEKMSRMLGELLELSRLGRVKHDPTDVRLADALGEAEELLAGRLAGVELDVEGADVVVRADRNRMVQVFQNLLENAAKYMGPQASPRIRVRCREEAGAVHVAVEDNGIGIAEAHQRRIFGLFDKLDPRSEGTGVGLALVKTIVELHGGRIWVESPGAGQGATFFVVLPRR